MQDKGNRRGGIDDGVCRIHDGRAKQLAHGVQIIGGAGHDVAGAVRVIEAERLPFQVAEEIVAQVELDLP